MNIGTELLGPGGRLHGIATAKDLAADTLLISWIKQGDKVLPLRARRWGDAGFKPGEYVYAMITRNADVFQAGGSTHCLRFEKACLIRGTLLAA